MNSDQKILFEGLLKEGDYCYIVDKGKDHISEVCPVELLFRDGNIHKVDKNVSSEYSTLSLEINGSFLKDSTGKIIGEVKVVRDTDSKRIEEALQESEKKYHALFDSAPVGIGIADLEGKVLECNASMLKMTGFTLEEIKSSDIGSTYVDPDERRLLIQNLQETGSVHDWEVRLKRKDGTIYYALLDAELLEIGQRKVLLTTARDISEYKQAEKEKDRFLKAFDVSIDGITIADEEDRFIYVNEAYANIFGYPREELIGKTWRKITPPDIIVTTEKELSNTIHKKDIGIFFREVPGMKKDGMIIPTEVRGRGIWDEKGNYQGYICVVRDITERKQAEEQIKASLKEKEVLLREIHHRVKNNMQIISSLLKLQTGYIEDKKYLEMFKESQNRILTMSLVHEKLYRSKDFTKINFKEYIHDLANGVFQSYSGRSSNILMNLNIENVDLGIDSAIPCGLIINELVTNSLKYAFPGEKKGEIKIVLGKIDGNKYELTVSDNGIGIPEYLDIRKTETLGLYLVSMLAEDQLSGKIELDRSKGTEFIIRFGDGI